MDDGFVIFPVPRPYVSPGISQLVNSSFHDANARFGTVQEKKNKYPEIRDQRSELEICLYKASESESEMD